MANAPRSKRSQRWLLTAVRTTLICTALVSAPLTLGGCSMLHSRSSVTPEMKITVVKVANEYISLIAHGNFSRASEKVLWVDYLTAKGGKTSKDQIRQQIEGLRAIPYERHPLKDLDILDLSVESDKAEIALKKQNDPASKEFVIKLIWAGRAWLVVGDTLLGPDGALASHPTAIQSSATLAEQRQEKPQPARATAPVITAPQHPAPNHPSSEPEQDLSPHGSSTSSSVKP